MNINFKIIIGIIYIGLNYFLPFIVLISPNFAQFSKHTNLVFGIIITLYVFFDSKFSYLLFNKNIITYFLFTILCIIFSIIFNQDININIISSFIYELISLFIIFIFYRSIARDNINAKLLFYSAAFFSIINSAIGLYGFLTLSPIMDVTFEDVGVGAFGYDPSSGRSGGIKGENYTGIWNVPGLVLGLSILYSGNKFSKIIALTFIILVSLASIVSLSRGSMLVSIFAILFYFILQRSFSIRNIIFLMFFSIFAYLYGFFIFNYILLNTSALNASDLSTKWTGSAPLSDIRTQIWASYLTEIFNLNLFFGLGPSYLKIPDNFKLGFLPHNSFLDVFVQFGLMGISLYVIPLFKVIRQLLKFYFSGFIDTYFVDFSVIVLSMSVGLFFLSDEYLKIYWIFIALTIGRIDSSLRGPIKCNFLSRS